MVQKTIIIWINGEQNESHDTAFYIQCSQFLNVINNTCNVFSDGSCFVCNALNRIVCIRCLQFNTSSISIDVNKFAAQKVFNFCARELIAQTAC